MEATVSDVLDVKGFLSQAEVASPPVLSRHVVLPWSGAAQTEAKGPTIVMRFDHPASVDSVIRHAYVPRLADARPPADPI